MWFIFQNLTHFGKLRDPMGFISGYPKSWTVSPLSNVFERKEGKGRGEKGRGGEGRGGEGRNNTTDVNGHFFV